MSIENIAIDILVNNKPVRKYAHEGKVFIEARDGQEYSIRIKNNTYSRIMAVSSVDGLDVITGKRALENGNGYILNGYASLKIDGFRVSHSEVAKFQFAKKEESYAASKNNGSDANVGVIGVVIFNELVKKIEPSFLYSKGITRSYGSSADYYSKDFSDSTTDSDVKSVACACSATLSSPEKARSLDMGTAFGEGKESKVTTVEFEIGYRIQSSTIYYASRKCLIDMGVPVDNETKISLPSPFADSQFATPPKNWKG